MNFKQRTMCRVLLNFFVCGYFIHITKSINPGLKAKISQQGIQYAADVATEILQQDAHKIQILPQRGQKQFEIGRIEHTVSNIKITSFTAPQATVSTAPFHWMLKGTSARLSADWSYDYKLFSSIGVTDSGSMDVVVSIDLDTTIQLDTDDNGRVTSHMIHCNCDVTRLDAHFQRDWLYNRVNGHIERYIRGDLQRKICSEAEIVINEKANAQLASLPLSYILHDTVMLDYSLVSSPALAPEYIELAFKGKFSWVTDPENYYFNPDVIPNTDIAGVSHMVGFWLTQSSINNLGYVAYKSNALVYHLMPSDLGPNERDLLGTTCSSLFKPCFGSIVSQVQQLYPNTSVSLSMYVTQPPTLHISPLGVTTEWIGIIEFYAMPQSSAPEFLFSTNTRVLFNISVALRDLTFTAEITSFQLKMSLNDTNIGDVSTVYLNAVMNIAMVSFIVPNLNQLGYEGFLLPMINNVDYLNPTLELLHGAVYAGIDLRYNRH